MRLTSGLNPRWGRSASLANCPGRKLLRKSTFRRDLAARLDEVATAVRGPCTEVLHSRESAAPLVFHSSCNWPFWPLPYGLAAGESKMDQADWKLRVFYQYQIAKIAKLAREQTHPASRKRLNFMLNQYIDMLLVMPRLNHAARAAGCCGVASGLGACRRSVAARSGETCIRASGCAGRPGARGPAGRRYAADGGLTGPGRIGADVVNLHGHRESSRRIRRTGPAVADRQIGQQAQ